eukprot:GEMP01043561.1.p1 GENE.GEMP01043561.1~~GEMP01043561.1.p1  ORF type:complete len:454 (+),score=97.35 GEMP01043561.1:32-1393(+)
MNTLAETKWDSLEDDDDDLWNDLERTRLYCNDLTGHAGPSGSEPIFRQAYRAYEVSLQRVIDRRGSLAAVRSECPLKELILSCVLNQATMCTQFDPPDIAQGKKVVSSIASLHPSNSYVKCFLAQDEPARLTSPQPGDKQSSNAKAPKAVAMMEEAAHRFKDKRYRDVVKMLQGCGDDCEAQELLMESHAHLGNVAEAIAHGEQAFHGLTAHAKVECLMTLNLLHKEQGGCSLEQWRELCTLAAHPPQHLRALVLASTSVAKITHAEEDFEAAIIALRKVRPQSQDTRLDLWDLALLRLEQNFSRVNMEECKKMALHPGTFAFWKRYAYLCADNRVLDEAMDALSKQLTVAFADSERADVHAHAAYLQRKMNDRAGFEVSKGLAESYGHTFPADIWPEQALKRTPSREPCREPCREPSSRNSSGRARRWVTVGFMEISLVGAVLGVASWYLFS